jgi:hypothetical protein
VALLLPTAQAATPADVWTDLGTSDPVKADQVTAYLLARPEVALPLLRERLKPVRAVALGQIDRLIADLDHKRFTLRERASRELERLGERAEPALRRALADRPSAEVRRRINLLLEGLRTQRLWPPPERLRLSRALDVLEQLGTPEAREILRHLARGAPEAELTVQAKAALDRLPPR